MNTSRLPAEWEPHRACWLAWPRLATEWPGHFEGARDEIAELAQQIATLGAEPVHLLVDESDRAQLAQRLIHEIDAGCIILEQLPFGDVWTRDTLP
ncbi:MAG: agmatine deiminase family protein [Deltaproteobacteria bacterium]|nr:agmatine deiminase family protein [Deltaproteobacteria bacterium]